MASPPAVRMTLSSCVEISPLTFQLRVLERWSERRWLRTVEHERQRTYTLSVGVGRFHDGEHFILRQDARHFPLFELWQAWRLEAKLDAYVFEPESPSHVLPPVPVSPRR